MLVMYSGLVHRNHWTWGWTMTVTQIDIDEDALAEAMTLSGTRTKKETVNLALREFAATHRRIAALEDSASLAETWDYEGWQQRHTQEKEPAE